MTKNNAKVMKLNFSIKMGVRGDRGEKKLESVTWTINLSLKLLDELFNQILEQLNESTKGINRTKICRGEKKAGSRDQVLSLLKDIGYITITNPADTKNSHMFEITEKGRYYVQLDTNAEKKRQLHIDMQEIFWYEFAYRKLIAREVEYITKKELWKYLVVESEKECLINRYDKHSFDNVLSCFLFTGVITESDGSYKISEDYKAEFDDRRFLEEVDQILKVGEKKYTIDVCNYLVNKRRSFVASKDEIIKISINEILQKLVEFENSKFRFIGGIPKPPIPAKRTIIERIG